MDSCPALLLANLRKSRVQKNQIIPVYLLEACRSLPRGHAGEQPTSDPCAEARGVEKKVNSFSKAPIFQSTLQALMRKADSDPATEYIAAFGKVSGGDTIASAIVGGSASRGYVPAVENAFADLHTHPKSTPPSSGDLYGLLLNYSRGKNCDMRFVVTAQGAIYALVVRDRALAGVFSQRYPYQQTPGYSPLFPDDLLQEYRDYLYRYGAPEELVMAFMLQKYKTGVVLLRRVSSGEFAVISVKVKQVGEELVFAPGDCP